MTLSNMVKEPRREIIETVVGLSLFGAAAFADYWFAIWFSSVITWIGPDGYTYSPPVPVSMFIGVSAVFVAFLVLIIVHALGDEVCNGLKKLGYDPRPTKRY